MNAGAEWLPSIAPALKYTRRIRAEKPQLDSSWVSATLSRDGLLPLAETSTGAQGKDETGFLLFCCFRVAGPFVYVSRVRRHVIIAHTTALDAPRRTESESFSLKWSTAPTWRHFAGGRISLLKLLLLCVIGVFGVVVLCALCLSSLFFSFRGKRRLPHQLCRTLYFPPSNHLRFDCGASHPPGPQVETFAGSFLSDNPRVDVLVNNAGGMPNNRTISAQGHEAIMVRVCIACQTRVCLDGGLYAPLHLFEIQPQSWPPSGRLSP